MSLASKILLSILAFLLVTAQAGSEPPSQDNWLGRDKLGHYALSAFIAGGTYIVAERHFDFDSEDSFKISVGITISIGAIKEIADFKSGKGDPSYKDLLFDFAGAITGAFLANLARTNGWLDSP